MTLTDFLAALKLCSSLAIKPLTERIDRLKTQGYEFDPVSVPVVEKSTVSDDGKPPAVADGRKSATVRSVLATPLPMLPQQEKKKKDGSRKAKQEEIVEVKEVITEEKVLEVVLAPPPPPTAKELEVMLTERYQQVSKTLQNYYELLIREHSQFQHAKASVEAASHRKQHRIALEHAAQLAKAKFFRSESYMGSREELDSRKSAMDLANVLIEVE
jgi:hypothetical protein